VECSGELGLGQFVRGVPIKEVVRRTGRRATRSARRCGPIGCGSVPGRRSKLDSLEDEIHRLLKDDAKLPGVRVREEPCDANPVLVGCFISDSITVSRYGAAGGLKPLLPRTT
jgi:hypothetical protein